MFDTMNGANLQFYTANTNALTNFVIIKFTFSLQILLVYEKNIKLNMKIYNVRSRSSVG